MTSTREPSLANIEAASFTHKFFIFHSFIYLGCCLGLSSDSLCNEKEWPSVITESSSPVDYPIQTPLVSFISLCALHEVGLIRSSGTLTITDIDHVSFMKPNVYPIPKRGGITDQCETKTC